MVRLITLLLMLGVGQQYRTMTNEQIAVELEKLAAELRLPEQPPAPPTNVVPVGASLSLALMSAEAGSTLELVEGGVYSCNCIASKKVTLKGKGIIETPNSSTALTITGTDVVLADFTVRASGTQNVNDLVVLKGKNTTLTDVTVQGNGATKRGIQANGDTMLFENVKVLNIRQAGTEAAAVGIWDGTKLTINNSVLQGASQSFLSGGAAPAVANHCPADITITNSTLTRDLAWRGGGYAVKTGFELKCAKRVLVQDSTIENVWVDGQTGAGITLTPSQYGNSPETVVEDVLFKRVKILNVGLGVNLLGFTQHTDPLRQTQRAHNIRFEDCDFVISKAANGGHGSLMQAGREPADIKFENNRITQDGEDFLRTSDSKPITGYSFTGNTVNRTGTYGVWTPTGSRGVGWAVTFPGGIIKSNTFTGAHATFKANFPDNTWR